MVAGHAATGLLDRRDTDYPRDAPGQDSPGAITAFALSAPLFNPLSLLYGLTLSRPYVILGFAFGSLLVVTVIGLLWDRLAKEPQRDAPVETFKFIGLKRLHASLAYGCRELCGPTGLLALIAVAGVGLLGMALPHGACRPLQSKTIPWHRCAMALLSVPVYATPMQTISH